MNRKFYVFVGFSISLVGSVFSLMLILAHHQSIPTPNGTWMIMTFIVFNIIANVGAWIASCAWWLEKEDSYDYYRKLRR